MKIKTSLNLFFGTALIIAVCGALLFTVRNASRYMKKNFYSSVPSMLEESCSDLQVDLATGLSLAENFASQPKLIRWFKNLEKDAGDEKDIKKTLVDLTNNEGFSTCFAASKLTGSYYVVDKNQKIIRDQLYETEKKDSWFFELIKVPQKIIYNIDLNKTLNITNFWFNAKIFDNNGEAIGFAGLAVNLNKAVKMKILSKKILMTYSVLYG